MAEKKKIEKTEESSLDKFAIFFEQKNSKKSAQNMMIFGVFSISLCLLIFFFYTTKTQIDFFSWDRQTVTLKETAQKEWEQSFSKQEKEKTLNEIKKQVSEFLQQVVSSTTSTPTINTSTVDLTVTNTLNIASSTTSSINNN